MSVGSTEHGPGVAVAAPCLDALGDSAVALDAGVTFSPPGAAASNGVSDSLAWRAQLATDDLGALGVAKALLSEPLGLAGHAELRGTLVALSTTDMRMEATLTRAAKGLRLYGMPLDRIEMALQWQDNTTALERLELRTGPGTVTARGLVAVESRSLVCRWDD